MHPARPQIPHPSFQGAAPPPRWRPRAPAGASEALASASAKTLVVLAVAASCAADALRILASIGTLGHCAAHARVKLRPPRRPLHGRRRTLVVSRGEDAKRAQVSRLPHALRGLQEGGSE